MPRSSSTGLVPGWLSRLLDVVRRLGRSVSGLCDADEIRWCVQNAVDMCRTRRPRRRRRRLNVEQIEVQRVAAKGSGYGDSTGAARLTRPGACAGDVRAGERERPTLAGTRDDEWRGPDARKIALGIRLRGGRIAAASQEEARRKDGSDGVPEGMGPGSSR